MKNFILILSLFLFNSSVSFGQKKINLLIKYDIDFDRYEVLAKPNFSQKNFIWGPSQISLALPSSVLIGKIQVRNVDGGTWEDNSVVEAPETKSDFSFHGISSGGDKVELIENFETVLFYFYLPKNVNPKKVRLFDNQNDPKSNDKGMLGGDFRNTIIDIFGEERFSEVQLIQEKSLEEPSLNSEEFKVSIYPNVVRNNVFSVGLEGINDKDGEILMILTDLNGKEVSRHKVIKSNLVNQKFSIPMIYNGNALLARFITIKGSSTQKIICEN